MPENDPKSLANNSSLSYTDSNGNSINQSEARELRESGKPIYIEYSGGPDELLNEIDVDDYHETNYPPIIRGGTTVEVKDWEAKLSGQYDPEDR